MHRTATLLSNIQRVGSHNTFMLGAVLRSSSKFSTGSGFKGVSATLPKLHLFYRRPSARINVVACRYF